jgi:hypothetical protein
MGDTEYDATRFAGDSASILAIRRGSTMTTANGLRSRMLGLACSGAIAIGLVSFLTLWTATSFSMKPSAAVTFGAVVLGGPFARLISGSMTAGQIGFAIFTIALIMAHSIRPSIGTFVLTVCGVVLWVLSGAFWILILA